MLYSPAGKSPVWAGSGCRRHRGAALACRKLETASRWRSPAASGCRRPESPAGSGWTRCAASRCVRAGPPIPSQTRPCARSPRQPARSPAHSAFKRCPRGCAGFGDIEQLLVHLPQTPSIAACPRIAARPREPGWVVPDLAGFRLGAAHQREHGLGGASPRSPICFSEIAHSSATTAKPRPLRRPGGFDGPLSAKKANCDLRGPSSSTVPATHRPHLASPPATADGDSLGGGPTIALGVIHRFAQGVGVGISPSPATRARCRGFSMPSAVPHRPRLAVPDEAPRRWFRPPSAPPISRRTSLSPGPATPRATSYGRSCSRPPERGNGLNLETMWGGRRTREPQGDRARRDERSTADGQTLGGIGCSRQIHDRPINAPMRAPAPGAQTAMKAASASGEPPRGSFSASRSRDLGTGHASGRRDHRRRRSSTSTGTATAASGHLDAVGGGCRSSRRNARRTLRMVARRSAPACPATKPNADAGEFVRAGGQRPDQLRPQRVPCLAGTRSRQRRSVGGDGDVHRRAGGLRVSAALRGDTRHWKNSSSTSFSLVATTSFADRQAHLAGDVAGADVAEVARHAEGDLFRRCSWPRNSPEVTRSAPRPAPS